MDWMVIAKIGGVMIRNSHIKSVNVTYCAFQELKTFILIPTKSKEF